MVCVSSLQVGSVGLQVTRSLGDFDQKGHGVVAHAEVTEYSLGPEDTGGCCVRYAARMLLWLGLGAGACCFYSALDRVSFRHTAVQCSWRQPASVGTDNRSMLLIM